MKQAARKIVMFFMIIGFIFGLSILLYPLVSNAWNRMREERLFQAYLEKNAAESSIDYEAEWAKARSYNEGLQPIILPDSFVAATTPYTEDEIYTACLNLEGNGLMGYIVIPKIDVKVPIYHSTEEAILEKGAGHLQGSSLPVGGESTHAVLAAHRGLPSASLFTDLDQLQEGDQFYLYILDDILAYEVDQIEVVKPEETDALSVERGKDQVTLLTCTPYGINTHRLLVRGKRIPYDEQAAEDQGRHKAKGMNTNYLFWVLIGLGSAGLFMIVVYIIRRLIRRKRIRRRKNEKIQKKE
ncbi:MAG: class C sortase [Lachnospiraceae bacterium]|nr:class C sortase [Lachnospiraceae bacterium]